jgi:hypothetical protein
MWYRVIVHLLYRTVKGQLLFHISCDDAVFLTILLRTFSSLLISLWWRIVEAPNLFRSWGPYLCKSLPVVLVPGNLNRGVTYVVRVSFVYCCVHGTWSGVVCMYQVLRVFVTAIAVDSKCLVRHVVVSYQRIDTIAVFRCTLNVEFLRVSRSCTMWIGFDLYRW